VSLFLAYANEARKASGAVQVDTLQRISDPGHFALIEQWQSQGAKQAFAATDPPTSIARPSPPLQSAAYDERIHSALSVGPVDAAIGRSGRDRDTRRRRPDAWVEPGTAKVKGFVEQGRTAKGNRRFDDLVQISRKKSFHGGRKLGTRLPTRTPGSRASREGLPRGAAADERGALRRARL